MHDRTHAGLVRLVSLELSRRALLKGAAAAGGAMALSGLARGAAFAQAQPFQSDVDVLNFALTLEHLEADLYNTIVGAGVIKNETFLKYVRVFQAHENEHAQALPGVIRQLGGTPVEKRPKYDYSAFDVSTEEKAMQVLTAVEEVGVGAYQGAAPFIKDKKILTAAVAIHGVEAEHTGSLHHLLGLKITGDSLAAAAGVQTKVLNGAFTQPIPPADVLKAVTPILG